MSASPWQSAARSEMAFAWIFMAGSTYKEIVSVSEGPASDSRWFLTPSRS